MWPLSSLQPVRDSEDKKRTGQASRLLLTQKAQTTRVIKGVGVASDALCTWLPRLGLILEVWDPHRKHIPGENRKEMGSCGVTAPAVGTQYLPQPVSFAEWLVGHIPELLRNGTGTPA